MGSSNEKVKIGSSDFSAVIRKALNETKDLTEKALQNAVDQTAKDTVKKIKGKSPIKTGDYRSGWTSKITRRAGRGGYGRTVHNSTCYRITHLLQNGHGGPRPAGPHPHIPSDEDTEKLFEQNLEREMLK